MSKYTSGWNGACGYNQIYRDGEPIAFCEAAELLNELEAERREWRDVLAGPRLVSDEIQVFLNENSDRYPMHTPEYKEYRNTLSALGVKKSQAQEALEALAAKCAEERRGE